MFNEIFTMNNTMCNKVGGLQCPRPPVYPTTLPSSYNNTQITQKMKYAQYIRIQTHTYGGPNSNDTNNS